MQAAVLRAGLMCAFLLSLAVQVQAQDRRTSTERRRNEREDSLQRRRVLARDSLRLRSISETRRQQDQVRADRDQVANDTRRGVPANDRTPVSAAATLPAAERTAESIRRDLAGVARTDTGVLRIITTNRINPADSLPAPSAPRAFIMRRSNQPGAPAFCQTGAGHPIFGRDWCFERGFRLGREWERDRVTDVRINRNAGIGRIDRARLEQMLGAKIVGRIEELGFKDEISGSWVDTPTGGLILRVASGSTQIAELADRNRDGRVDVLWLRSRR
jgi:hypothetical protein